MHEKARAARKVDIATHRINHHPADSVVCFVHTSPLDSYLTCGLRYPLSRNLLYLIIGSTSILRCRYYGRHASRSLHK